jgi:hypothetical protein
VLTRSQFLHCLVGRVISTVVAALIDLEPSFEKRFDLVFEEVRGFVKYPVMGFDVEQPAFSLSLRGLSLYVHRYPCLRLARHMAALSDRSSSRVRIGEAMVCPWTSRDLWEYNREVSVDSQWT